MRSTRRLRLPFLPGLSRARVVAVDAGQLEAVHHVSAMLGGTQRHGVGHRHRHVRLPPRGLGIAVSLHGSQPGRGVKCTPAADQVGRRGSA